MRISQAAKLPSMLISRHAARLAAGVAALDAIWLWPPPGHQRQLSTAFCQPNTHPVLPLRVRRWAWLWR